MAFDESKVPVEHADLFFHGGPPDEFGRPRGLSDEQWDAQKARMLAEGTYPFQQAGN